jgi:hypothetical protein
MRLNFKYDEVAVPSQAWSGPEGSRKLRFLDFMTTNMMKTTENKLFFAVQK